jgi:hypothetical protein
MEKWYSPKQVPVPTTGGFVMHFNGGSQVPEKPPNPPHASPSILAQILQHLKWNKRKKRIKHKIYNMTFCQT